MTELKGIDKLFTDLEERALEGKSNERFMTALCRAEVRWGSLTSLVANIREPRWTHKFLADDNKRLFRQIITGHLCQVR